MTEHSQNRSLRRFNNFLSIVVIFAALYIILTPFMPQMGWWVRHSAPLISRPAATLTIKPGAPLPKDNRLVIPAIDVDNHIFEGTSPYTVNKGIWMRPNSSQPDKGSNTVLAAHVFTYIEPRGPFYFLNKLKMDDEVTVFWKQKAYTYRVHNIKTVPPTTVEVEAPSPDPILTMYTCTPLWNPTQRLVVVAKLEQTR